MSWPTTCTHHACRCARANELAIQAERTGRNDLLAQGIAVHEQSVPCRERCDRLMSGYPPCAEPCGDCWQ